MPSQNLPDFDTLWDYSHPDQTETKFCEILLQFHEPEHFAESAQLVFTALMKYNAGPIAHIDPALSLFRFL